MMQQYHTAEADRRNKQPTQLCAFALSVLTVAMTLPTHAQSSQQTEQTSAQTQPAVTHEKPALERITVYGEQTETQLATHSRVGLLGDKGLMETPFNVISYTDKFMSDIQASDISDVIAKTDPTVFASGIAGESNESYSIRGLASSVGDVTINGLAGMAAYYRNSPEMFERVELLKGPSALLNGMPPKGSAGGAINLVPKRAGDIPIARLNVDYGNNSRVGGHVDLGRRFGDEKQFGVRFNGVYRDGETAVETQDKKNTLVSLGVDWRNSRASLSADIYHSEDQVYGLTRGMTLAADVPLPTPPEPDISWNPPWAFYDSVDRGAMLRGEYDLNKQLTLYAAVGSSKTEFDSNMGAAQIINKEGDFRINFSGVADEIERQSAEVGIQGKLQTASIGHQFAINATYYDEDYTLSGFRNLLPEDWVSNIYAPVWGPKVERPDNIPTITETDTRLTSVGFADTLSFADERLLLTLGARRQQVRNESFSGFTGERIGARYKESATTPALAVLFKANDSLSLYANYVEGLSQGAMAPNTAENAGEVFAPYKTKQKEAGVKFQQDQFSSTFSVYEIKRPSSYTDPITNIFSFGGEQRNRGAEWGASASVAESLRLMGGVAYTDAELTKTANDINQGKQATGIPKWQAKLRVEWDLPELAGLTLTADAASASKQYLSADNTLSIPGRTIFDVGARYTTNVASHPLTLRATLSNVTNKAYWAKPHFTSLALGAPRTVQVSLSMDF